MSIKCSVCILTYNSGKTLRKCLESVKDFTDIVILDGGSSDATLRIAGLFNARIYSQGNDGASGKITDFTEARRKSFNAALEDWCLWLDSDEWLSDELRERIKNIVQSGKKNILYSFLRKAIVGGRIIEYMYTYPEYCKRLFNKDSDVTLKKGKAVHEDLMPGPESAILKIDAVIYHQWQESYEDLKRKDNYYIALMLNGKEGLGARKKLRIALINLLKASRALLKSFMIYVVHGFKETLPVAHSWRFVRYHLHYVKKIIFI